VCFNEFGRANIYVRTHEFGVDRFPLYCCSSYLPTRFRGVLAADMDYDSHYLVDLSS
jgi:hypothetical protein